LIIAAPARTDFTDLPPVPAYPARPVLLIQESEGVLHSSVHEGNLIKRCATAVKQT